MNGPTHLTAGACSAVIVATALGSDDGTTAIGLAVACVAALFPDWLAVSFPFVRLPLEGHR